MTIITNPTHQALHNKVKTHKLTITRSFSFDAAHQLPLHDGKCKRLHGHTYRLDIAYEGYPQPVDDNNPSSGMVLDFADLKRGISDIMAEFLDHHYLNDVVDYPTAERVLQWVVSFLLLRFGNAIQWVRLSETEDCSVSWINPEESQP